MRHAAVGKLTNQAALANVALSDRSIAIRQIAASKLTDPAVLAKVATKDGDATVRLAAVWRLNSRPTLRDIIKSDVSQVVRQAAADKLQALDAQSAAMAGASISRVDHRPATPESGVSQGISDARRPELPKSSPRNPPPVQMTPASDSRKGAILAMFDGHTITRGSDFEYDKDALNGVLYFIEKKYPDGVVTIKDVTFFTPGYTFLIKIDFRGPVDQMFAFTDFVNETLRHYKMA
jgi:hypothetical protein